MASAPISVFILGATGYVGGSVLVRFQREYPDFTWTALVRNPKDVSTIQALGVNVVQGTQLDLDLIESTAAKHDAVLNIANSDDLPLTQAVLRGLESRARSGNVIGKPILLHTSGSGVVTDTPWDGAYHPGTSDKVWDDTEVEDTKSIAPEQMHRNVDLTIFEAGERGLVDAYIVAPTTIYGKGRGPVRNLSVQVNSLIRTAVKYGQVLQVGPGTNVWSNVHIDELVDLYVLLFNLALSSRQSREVVDPYERWFWGSSTRSHVWGDITRELAKILYAKGIVQKGVRSVSLEEAEFGQEFGLVITAHNSRVVANRGFALGWRPHGPTLEETLEGEVEWTLAQL
ncbi:hypothetical protein M407DRAFT_22891 [Tulasnella calospora MUT 4182]|uniref:NAD(P)-binding domain-containing protein n=1 Tax=Tulasnella calospora MUT 4182 TaxID=1051891 RepID=A0A0C3QM46_9AGAM|nr:hypothetical protein M407DRAFT_22891 [Tulasnella calospora MUT 4182]